MILQAMILGKNFERSNFKNEFLAHRLCSALGIVAFSFFDDQNKIDALKQTLEKFSTLGFATILQAPKLDSERTQNLNEPNHKTQNPKSQKSKKPKRAIFLIYSLLRGDEFKDTLFEIARKFGFGQCAYASADGSWDIYQKNGDEFSSTQNLNAFVFNDKCAIDASGISLIASRLFVKLDELALKPQIFENLSVVSIKEDSLLSLDSQFWFMGDLKICNANRADKDFSQSLSQKVIIAPCLKDTNLAELFKYADFENGILGVFVSKPYVALRKHAPKPRELIFVLEPDFELANLAQIISPYERKFAYAPMNFAQCAQTSERFFELARCFENLDSVKE